MTREKWILKMVTVAAKGRDPNLFLTTRTITEVANHLTIEGVFRPSLWARLRRFLFSIFCKKHHD